MDVSSYLPTLKRAPGLHTWTPATDKHLTFNASYTSYIDSLPQDKRATSKMMKSHWPPAPEEVEGLHLERCMRIYPHLQDTGGFFVAVFERKKRRSAATQGSMAQSSSATKRDLDVEPNAEEPDSKRVKIANETAEAEIEVVDEAIEAELKTGQRVSNARGR